MPVLFGPTVAVPVALNAPVTANPVEEKVPIKDPPTSTSAFPALLKNVRTFGRACVLLLERKPPSV